MTLSVPSFLAAAASALIPPPADAEVTVDQSVPPAEPEDPEEHPAPSSVRAASPAIANRYDALTRFPPVSFPHPPADCGRPKARGTEPFRTSADPAPVQRHRTKRLKRLAFGMLTHPDPGVKVRYRVDA